MRRPTAVPVATFLLLAIGSCAPREAPSLAPVPAVSREPEFRIGILLDVPRATIGGGSALRIVDPDEGGSIGVVSSQRAVDAVPIGGDVSLVADAGRVQRSALVIEAADSGGLVRLNGRDYRGTLEVRQGARGLVVVNRIGLERYVAGVVGAEMGQRQAGELEALKAQAVVSRTYAIRNQGRWTARGFDLVADQDNQVYGGQQAEYALASSATAATRGEVLTYDGQPIDAFYFSTCGGETEDGNAVFANASRPYLRSVDDRDNSGTPWCAISPRYEWHDGWTARELRETLARTLPANGLPATRAADLTDIRVPDRTPSGRSATIELVGDSGNTSVSGQAIRRVLVPPGGTSLRSTDFTVRISRQGGRIERVDLDGHGSGHGVGMCQWGAIGRARAGQDYAKIVRSYFPGTELHRLY